jgi:hypothetical protein
MEDLLTRFVHDLMARASGPMHLRLILQPIMALLFAARAGFRDAKTGRPPYFWGMFGSRRERRELMREGWQDVGKVFLIALVLDVIYQLIAVRWVYPVESLTVAVALAFIPYVLSRGIFTRLARLGSRRAA